MLKLRSADSAQKSDESVEVVRRRAQYRLVGTLVLVVVGVVGFPLVFDTQPRTLKDDLTVVIPDKTQVHPLAVASTAQASPVATPASEPVVTPAPAPEPKASTIQESVSAAVQSAMAKPEPAKVAEVKPLAKTESPKPEPKSDLKPEPKPAAAAPAATDSARAKAILEGKPVSAAAASQRLVIQVGSYSDQASVTRVRRQLESAGLTTYTQVISTSQGKLTRVRLGPFDTAAQADKAAAQVKKLGLEFSIVRL